MTLLIGILCSDGAVIAADRQATHGALGIVTVGQEVTKIVTIGEAALFASSGHHGMSQQYEGIITQWIGEGYFIKNSYGTAIGRIQQAFGPILEGAFKRAHAALPILGHAAQSDCICGSIFVAEFKDGMKIVEISPQLAVEYLSTELSFVSLGSGKQTADPFLGFLKKIFWPDRLPTVREAILAGYWTISHAIALRVSGVGMGVDLFTLEKSNNTWRSHRVEETEVEEHKSFIAACEDALRGVQTSMTLGAADAAAAPVPSPGSN